MDTLDAIRALRRSWMLILGALIMCVAASAMYTARIAPTYESHAQLFVAAPRAFSLQRAPSYAELVKSPYIAGDVVSRLHLSGTGRDLARQLSAMSPPGTVLINIAVKDRSPQRAQQIGIAVADKLIAFVPRLERKVAPQARLYVSSPASLPSTPVSPNARLNVLAGAIFGLLLGLLAAILRRLVDRRISSPENIPAGSGPALLAELPIDDSLVGRQSSGLRALDSVRAEGLRELRTNVRFVRPDNSSLTIAVTSSVAGEGTSTTAIGLAMAIADAGSHVILVETDLRHPTLCSALGLRPSEGLAGYLSSEITVGRLLQRVSAGSAGGGLQALVAGVVPPNPSELLSSPRLPELLQDVRARCDVVIVDAPPVLTGGEAAVIAAAVDGVVLVVGMGHVTRPELGRSLEQLADARARVLGLVANGVGHESWGSTQNEVASTDGVSAPGGADVVSRVPVESPAASAVAAAPRVPSTGERPPAVSAEPAEKRSPDQELPPSPALERSRTLLAAVEGPARRPPVVARPARPATTRSRTPLVAVDGSPEPAPAVEGSSPPVRTARDVSANRAAAPATGRPKPPAGTARERPAKPAPATDRPKPRALPPRALPPSALPSRERPAKPAPAPSTARPRPPAFPPRERPVKPAPATDRAGPPPFPPRERPVKPAPARAAERPKPAALPLRERSLEPVTVEMRSARPAPAPARPKPPARTPRDRPAEPAPVAGRATRPARATGRPAPPARTPREPPAEPAPAGGRPKPPAGSARGLR